MGEVIKPELSTYWIARSNDDSVLHTGVTLPNQVTTTGLNNFDIATSEVEYLGVVGNHVAALEPMPDMGTELTTNDIFSWNGLAFMVRQDHVRTEHGPDTVPALFFRYRVDVDNESWIEGELVNVGNTRSYNGSDYTVIQSHQTQVGWEPPNVPALWAAAVEPSADWQAGVDYAVNDEVVYNSVTYQCLQAHTSLTGWEPSNVPALWQVVVMPSAEWQAGVAYAVGDEVEYNGATYVCLQAHTSISVWQPPNVPALWGEL